MSLTRKQLISIAAKKGWRSRKRQAAARKSDQNFAQPLEPTLAGRTLFSPQLRSQFLRKRYAS